MSLRLRIFLTFALLALLPALPATWAVRQLIHKSFELGLSKDLRAGLDAGAQNGRRYLRSEARLFHSELRTFLDSQNGSLPREFEWIRLDAKGGLLEQSSAFNQDDAEALLAEVADLLSHPRDREDIKSLRVASRKRMSALVTVEAGYLLASKPLGAAFLQDFDATIHAQQLQAGLDLEKERLSRGFLYPFLLVYLLLLLFSMVLAGLLSRRLTRGLDTLVEGSERIGAGDWSLRLDPGGRDEVGKLVLAFNDMVAKLEGQQRRLLDMEKMSAWRDMARGLAHEIKNPLTPITLVVQELRDRYAGEDEQFAKLLSESGRIIEEEVESLRVLSREFSEFARTPEMKKLPSDLNGLLRDQAHLYGSVPVRLNLMEELPEFDFDSEQMRRVLSNLFENSISALEGVANAQIEVATDINSEGQAILIFSDNGPGVPDEIRERIFEPHFTTKGSGMGLGLALVRSVLLLHGGEVKLEEGPGARFRLCLPMEDAS
jgi:nitrogen fixation/metabolism regulation signal transduction histidine kinase